jgi:hypothetical protein
MLLAEATGAGWMRNAVSWAEVEPVRGTFNFNRTDQYLTAVTDAGFNPVVFITGNPTWAANTPCGPIDTTNSALLGEFSTFMRTLAVRYPLITLWSLYNEPDNSTYAINGYTSGGCFGDHASGDINGNGLNDRADYARMLAAAWKAIHQANPNARLAVGAVAYDYFDSTAPEWYETDAGGHFNYHFLPELFAYMQAHPPPSGEKYADLLLFNYFDFFAERWQLVGSGYGIQPKAEELRKQMAAYGLALPLLVTETGIDSPSYGQAAQAFCLNRTMVRAGASGLRGILWWTFRDQPPYGLYYGLVKEDLSQKASYLALRTLTRELDGFVYSATRTKTTGFGGIEAYEFKRGADTKLVLWSTVISDASASEPCARPRDSRRATFGPGVSRLRIVDLTGAVSSFKDNTAGDLDTRAGYMAFSVAGRPKFVQPNP